MSKLKKKTTTEEWQIADFPAKFPTFYHQITPHISKNDKKCEIHSAFRLHIGRNNTPEKHKYRKENLSKKERSKMESSRSIFSQSD